MSNNIVKKMIAILLILILVCGIIEVPCYAKDNAEIVQSMLRSDTIYYTMAELGAVVELGDVSKIFQKISEIYPHWINEIKAIKNDTTYSYTPSGDDTVNADIMKAVLKKRVIFDSFAKLVDVESTGDNAKIFMCVLDIYPDIVEALDDCITEYNESHSGLGTILSAGYPEIVYGVGGFAVGFLIALFIFRKKKVDVSSKVTEDENE